MGTNFDKYSHTNIQEQKAIIVVENPIVQPTQLETNKNRHQLRKKSQQQRKKQTQPIQIKQQESIKQLESNIQAIKQQNLPIPIKNQPILQSLPQEPPKAYSQLSQLIITTIPVHQVKLVKQCQRKRTQILWLKELADTQKQNTRDATLREYGYQLYSTTNLTKLFEKYKQKSSHNALLISTIVLFSYSHFYNNQQTIKRLYQFFIKQGRIVKLFIIKPREQSEYNMQFNNITTNQSISELAYPIEYIRHKIMEFEVSQPNSCVHFLQLKYWEGRQGLHDIYQSKHQFHIYATKSKIAVQGCLKIGQKLIEELQQKGNFKNLLKSYAQFHDLYMNDSILMKQINKDKNYLQRIGLKLLEDPTNFYLNPTHHILINRLMAYCGDRPQYLNGVVLPLNLLTKKIVEDYRKDRLVRQYRDQFISYFHTILDYQLLETMNKDTVFQNIGFIKADLKMNHSSSSIGNAIFIIHVDPIQRDLDSDAGYCFIGSKPKDIEQDQQQEKSKSFFQGYSHVLFNLFNSFKVISRHFDNKINKHIIELQYGYISAQIDKKKMVNFISQQEVRPRYIENQHKETIDYETIIKYESNRDPIEKIEDYGDCFSFWKDTVKPFHIMIDCLPNAKLK